MPCSCWTRCRTSSKGARRSSGAVHQTMFVSGGCTTKPRSARPAAKTAGSKTPVGRWRRRDDCI
eukprot:6543041-Prymnesium_polylepis.2